MTDPLTTRARRGLGRAAASRTHVELLRFWRTREEVLFTFLFPVVLMLLFSAILTGEIGDTGVSFPQYLLAGLIASTAINVGVNSLTPQLVIDRTDGTVKRLAATPMPPAAYVLGKIGLVVVTAALQIVTLLVVGAVVTDVDLPDAAGWVTLVWVLLLGLVSSTLAGMALSTVISDARSSSAVVTLPFVVLQFISGIWFVFGDLPGWLQGVASVFPLRWMALGLRSVFLPDSFRFAEPGQSWQLGTVALVLGAWALGGSVLVLTRFRLRVER